MVDFLKESRKAAIDKSFKDMQEQRINQMKSLEKWDISNTLSKAVLDTVESKKSKVKTKVTNDSKDISDAIESDFKELKVYIKGKVTSGIKDAYDDEDKKLKSL